MGIVKVSQCDKCKLIISKPEEGFVLQGTLYQAIGKAPQESSANFGAVLFGGDQQAFHTLCKHCLAETLGIREHGTVRGYDADGVARSGS